MPLCVTEVSKLLASIGSRLTLPKLYLATLKQFLVPVRFSILSIASNYYSFLVFSVVMVAPISLVHRHIPALGMERPWLQEPGCQMRIWNLCSFIRQVRLKSPNKNILGAL